MARYRLKSDEEIAWNVVRRAVTARLRLQAAAWVEKQLNDLLPPLQVEFSRMLQRGEMPVLEPEYEEWLDVTLKAMRDGLPEGKAE